MWGDYGLRLKDHHYRIPAVQLKNAEDTLRKKLRGMRFRLFMRVSANIPVYTKGNEVFLFPSLSLQSNNCDAPSSPVWAQVKAAWTTSPAESPSPESSLNSKAISTRKSHGMLSA